MRRAAAVTTSNDPFSVAGNNTAATAATGSAGTWTWREAPGPSKTTERDEFVADAEAEIVARQIRRELVRKVAAAERERFYAEHASLTDKSFTEGLSTREQARLRYVQWQLDVFEDADIGDRLDELEQLAAVHARIAGDIAAFAEHAVATSKNRGRR